MTDISLQEKLLSTNPSSSFLNNEEQKEDA